MNKESQLFSHLASQHYKNLLLTNHNPLMQTSGEEDNRATDFPGHPLVVQSSFDGVHQYNG